ncbi:hypothetical protein B0H65DRAFT_441140 [Neurospora tetraspora]|uniref:Uncharacterized protein n=1 Tax=Neurospora tetraspora TaxID=94610 RepID=A0AAE0JGL0_9PEZI|nr:hypothetical protein B0H65DRAFT_441140 [Neurospora tetraspora]
MAKRKSALLMIVGFPEVAVRSPGCHTLHGVGSKNGKLIIQLGKRYCHAVIDGRLCSSQRQYSSRMALVKHIKKHQGCDVAVRQTVDKDGTVKKSHGLSVNARQEAESCSARVGTETIMINDGDMCSAEVLKMLRLAGSEPGWTGPCVIGVETPFVSEWKQDNWRKRTWKEALEARPPTTSWFVSLARD